MEAERKKNRIDLLIDFNLSLLNVVSKILHIESSIELILAENYNKTDNQLPISSIVYHQVFEQKIGFVSNASVIDLIFNEGPEAKRILRK